MKQVWSFAVICMFWYFASPVFHTRRFNKLNKNNFILHFYIKKYTEFSCHSFQFVICHFIKHKPAFSWRLSSSPCLSQALCVTFMKFLMPVGERNLTTSWALNQSLEFIYYSLLFVSSVWTISLIQKRVAETNVT